MFESNVFNSAVLCFFMSYHANGMGLKLFIKRFFCPLLYTDSNSETNLEKTECQENLEMFK